MEAPIVLQEEIPILIDTNFNFMTLDTHYRGFHAYIDIWNTKIGEELNIFKETENEYDKSTVAVKRKNTVSHDNWLHWTTHK